MSNLSELLPAGAGAKSASFVASGTLSSGQAVILNSDGTVSGISTTGNPASFGSLAQVSSNIDTAYKKCLVYPNSTTVVYVYGDSGNSYYPTAIAGTVSGTTITWGTPVVMESVASYSGPQVVYSNTDSVYIMVWQNNTSNNMRGVKATLSGTTFTFGSIATLGTSYGVFQLVLHQSKNIGTMFYKRQVDSSIYYINVEMGNGTVMSLASEKAAVGSNVSDLQDCDIYQAGTTGCLTYRPSSPASQALLAFQYGTDYTSSFTFGSGTTVASSTSQGAIAINQDTGYTLVLYKTTTYTSAIQAKVYSGISSGTTLTLASTNTSLISEAGLDFNAFYMEGPQLLGIAYDPGSNASPRTYKIATGTFASTTVSISDTASATNIAANSTGGMFVEPSTGTTAIMVSHDRDGTNTTDGQIYTSPTSNNTDFIGITDQAIADTATGAVIVQGGVSDKVTGLTTGSDYYVQSNGTLSTTVSSVPAGRALSSTSILLEG